MISTCILTYNEEKNIQDVIDNVQDAVDEIVIVDGYSSDKTVDIIKKNSNISFYQRALNNNFGEQRNFAIEKAKGEWIFMLDADERCSDGLKHFLKQIDTIKQYDGATILWKNYSDNNLVEVPRKLCLFKRYGYYQDALHEKVTGLKHIANIASEDIYLTHYKTRQEQLQRLQKYHKIIEENLAKAKKTDDYKLFAYYEYALKRHKEKEQIWLYDYVEHIK